MTDAPPHLLFVAWGFPPARGSGVYRAWATANEFARAGWAVTVLTAERELFERSTGTDESLERQIEPSIVVDRIPFRSAAFESDLRRWPRARALAPELWNVVNGWRESRRFPERGYADWRPALEAAARRIHAQKPVDLVIGTANPHVDFLPGHVLHAEHAVPYVMDYRDAWALDIYSGRRRFPARSVAGRWERRLLSDAERVWFVNRPIRDWYAAQHPDLSARFQVVENGYDGEPPVSTRMRPATGAGVTFGYIGTIAGAVPIEELVQGWELARSRSPLVAASRIELYGYLNHTGVPGDNLVRAMGSFERNAISYRGPVARADVGATYAQFDALVLTFGAGRFITGGKVYEYASTGLPIISVHDPVNETSRILADHPGWQGVRSMAPADIADAFIDVASAAAAQTDDDRARAREDARRFARSAQLAPQIAELTDLARKRRR
jgi:glycosyltransferase involved in cell wall biosynthesis